MQLCIPDFDRGAGLPSAAGGDLQDRFTALGRSRRKGEEDTGIYCNRREDPFLHLSFRAAEFQKTCFTL